MESQGSVHFGLEPDILNSQGGNNRSFYKLILNSESMKQRKVWTSEQDQVLKLLIEERGLTKWSLISEIMEKEFALVGRNGKQCRERYHNHLDKNITTEEWSLEEQSRLFELQESFGNKWALISSKLPGRSDNCVKNHFYSKLRKSLRKINKKIQKHFKRDYKDIKTATLYKIIEIMENQHKQGTNPQEETLELCRKIKNKLRQYDEISTSFEGQNDELNYIRGIIEDISVFDKDIKKNSKKGALKSSLRLDDEVTSPKTIKNKSQNLSTQSMYDESESSYSNSDIFSSSSNFDRSLCSIRSHKSQKVNKVDVIKSEKIQSQSEPDSEYNEQQQKLLYKSANSLTHLKKNTAKPNNLSSSLRLPVTSYFSQKPVVSPPPALEKEQSQQIKSASNKSSKSDPKQTFYHYMMGQQPFSMRLLSPKKLTIEEKFEINHENDDLFYGENMEIEDDSLIQHFNSFGLGQIPKLGHSNEL